MNPTNPQHHEVSLSDPIAKSFVFPVILAFSRVFPRPCRRIPKDSRYNRSGFPQILTFSHSVPLIPTLENIDLDDVTPASITTSEQ